MKGDGESISEKIRATRPIAIVFGGVYAIQAIAVARTSYMTLLTAFVFGAPLIVIVAWFLFAPKRPGIVPHAVGAVLLFAGILAVVGNAWAVILPPQSTFITNVATFALDAAGAAVLMSR